MKTNKTINYAIALSLFYLLNEVSFSQTVKTLSYNVNQIKGETIVFGLFSSNIIFPDSTCRNCYVPDEIVISCNEQFKVELTNCSIEQDWVCHIEDSTMKLIRCDTVLTDTTIKLTYSFIASEDCKGCLVFFNSNYQLDQHPFAVQYTCSPITPIEFNLTNIEWLIDTTGSFSELKIFLSGSTNASKIKVETYGDGLTGAVSIYPKNDGSFSDTVSIAFSHVPGITLKNNTRIAIFGAIGYPRILTVLNNGAVSVKETNESQMVKRFNLFQNYPNPFNPSTTIKYTLPYRSQVKLQIFNILGQLVKVLVNNEQTAGYQSVIWDTSISSGLYFYRLEAISKDDPSKRFVETKKMILLR